MIWRVRTVPVEREAAYFDGTNANDVRALDPERIEVVYLLDDGPSQKLWCRTVHGVVTVEPGCWVVRGEVDCWPVKAEHFERAYEMIEVGSSQP